MQRLAYKISNRLVGKCEYLLITHRLTELIFLELRLDTASDGSVETTTGRVVSPCSIMVHRGFRSKEASSVRKQKYRLHQTTSHSSLLLARQGDVSRKLNQAFLLVDPFSFYFVDEERSYVTGMCHTNVLLSRDLTIREKPADVRVLIFF